MEIRIRLSDNMSKIEESAILVKLSQAFQKNPDNYLASLFTNDFVQWAHRRIKDDFLPDVMEYICDAERKLSEETADLRKERDAAVSESVVCKRLLAQKEAELEASTKSATIISAFLTDANKLKRRLSEQVYVLETEVNRLQKENQELSTQFSSEITSLKAQLFDLITENAKSVVV